MEVAKLAITKKIHSQPSSSTVEQERPTAPLTTHGVRFYSALEYASNGTKYSAQLLATLRLREILGLRHRNGTIRILFKDIFYKLTS